MEDINRKIVIFLDKSNNIGSAVEFLKSLKYEVVLYSTTQILKDKIIKNTELESGVERLVSQTCSQLTDDLSKKFTLDSLSRRMGTNRSHLASAFKSILGKGVFEWFREYKLNQAKILILTTNLPIQTIAFDVGFDNQANFSSAYKKYFGLSPRRHRSKK